ncbi:Outer membrane efflux protein [Verrucomicrobia bacterium]|nr:Outer membrane efflux protein [Verrucomicrobiota bacterium]
MKRLFPFLVLGVLAGCSRFQPRPLSPGESAAQLEGRALTNEPLRTFLETNLHRPFISWPAPAWDFDMLTLAAFYYHPSLEVARAEWRTAQGAIKTAGGRLNPSVSVTPAYDYGIPGNYSPWLPLITFDIPIETAGKRRRRIEQAQFLSESARLNIATAAWQVRSELRSSLLDFVAAQQRAQILERQVALQKDIRARLEQQLQAGAIATAEITAARVALAKVSVDLADAQSQSAEARARVAEAVGVPVSALNRIVLNFDLSSTSSTDLITSTEARRAALQGRSDILAGLADYAASQAALQLEIARQYPDVHLSPGYSWNQGSAGDSQWQLGITVELPVLNRNQGPIAEAEARRAASAARFLALQARVIGQIDRSFAVYEASSKSLSSLGTLAAAQKALHQSTQAQYQAGAADQLELLSSELELNTASLAQLGAQAKLQQAIGALEDAVQRPLELPQAIFQSSSIKAK